jgi:hypothetical protein
LLAESWVRRSSSASRTATASYRSRHSAAPDFRELRVQPHRQHGMLRAMTTLAEIENAITQLTLTELDKLRAWFSSFDSQCFDEKIEKDAKTGKLDRFANEARTELRSGCALDL